MNGLALCSGIGGLDLGLRLAIGESYRTVCHVEREAYAAAVLVARMEDAALDAAPVWDDLLTFDGRRWRGVVDLVHAGFPCQPWSVAGKKLGTADERWIWPDIARIIAECDAPLAFLENVPGLLRHGLSYVLHDLAALGFDAEWTCVSASDVGLPHKRERIFVLAYRPERGLRVLRESSRGEGQPYWSDATLENAPWLPGGEWAGRQRVLQERAEPLADCDCEQRSANIRESNRETDGRHHAAWCRRTLVADADEGGLGWRTSVTGREAVERDTSARAGEVVGDSQQPRADTDTAQRGSRDSVGEPGVNVGDTRHGNNREQGRGEQTGWSIAASPGRKMGYATGSRREGLRHAEPRRLAFPPGPSDAEGWREYIAAGGPEPVVRRGADGVHDRLDRLRALGNAVVPRQAAAAFRELRERVLRG